MTKHHKPPSTIGSGVIVLKRGAGSKARLTAGKNPYEHQDQATAEVEAARLAVEHGVPFEVFHRVATAYPPAQEPDKSLAKRRKITLSQSK